MAQVFGNRILGGIGAPGGGMSESFGAGVNTALGQRSTRQGMEATAQDMRMRDIDLQWKTEDREEAKRRRAAAASAKARRDAMNAELMAGVRVPEAPVTALPPQGPSYPIPVAPVTGRPSLTFGGATAPGQPPAITGGGGAATVGGAAGSDVLRGGVTTDRLGAPTVGPSFEQVGREVGAASIMDMANTDAARAAMAVPPGQSRFRPAGAEPPLRPGFGSAVTGLEGGTNGFQQLMDMLTTRTGRTAEESATSPIAGPSFESAGRGADVALPPATPPGPVTITMPDGSTMEFDTGTGPQYPTAPQANLTFGPKLGAVTDRPDLSVSMRVLGAASGQSVPPAQVEQYVMTPVRVGAEMQEALSTRDELVRQAGVYQKYNDAEGFTTTLRLIEELDDQLVDLQTAQGLVDLQFNSPQRLEAALSAKTGWDIAVQPNPQGTFDVFVDGQLWQKMDRDQIGSFSQGLLDDAYAAKQAERAQQQFEAQLEIEKAIATEGIKTEYGMVLEAMKADRVTQELLLKAQLNPANTELVKSEVDGKIYVYDKLAQQYVGYIDPQPINPQTGEPLTQPLFIPYSQ